MQTSQQIIAAEILAIAVSDLFPGAQLVGGNGDAVSFYYDFIISQPVDEQAIPLIEEKIRSIIKEELPLETLEMMRENAASLFDHHNQSLKAGQIAEDLKNIVQIIRIGDFHDFIPDAPLVQLANTNTGMAGAVKILSLSQEKRSVPGIGEASIIHFEGAAAKDRQQLKKFIKIYEAEKQHGHVQLGKEMELFTSHENASLGGWFWHPKGMILKDMLLSIWKDTLQKSGFQFISTPGMLNISILEKKLSNPSFFIDGIENVPFTDKRAAHAFFFGANPQLKLPLRLAEWAEVLDPRHNIRFKGMCRTRIFSADSLQIFCDEGQVLNELISSLQFFDKTINMLGFEYQWKIVDSRGKDSIGAPANWKKSADWLTKALTSCGFEYGRDPIRTARFGPRIAICLLDPLGRHWTGPWLGIDWIRPELFALEYRGTDDKTHRPLMISGALFGSIERLVALLLERYKGLPFWLMPEQVRILPVGTRHIKRAEEFCSALKEENFRAGIYPGNESLGSKVHAAEKARIPYIIIVGDKEEKEGTITVRSSIKKGESTSVTPEKFLRHLKEEAGRNRQA